MVIENTTSCGPSDQSTDGPTGGPADRRTGEPADRRTGGPAESAQPVKAFGTPDSVLEGHLGHAGLFQVLQVTSRTDPG